MDTTPVLFEMFQVSFVLLSIIRLTELMPKLTSGTPLFEMSGMLEDQKSEQLSVFDLRNTEILLRSRSFSLRISQFVGK